jgi:hypothetical protein
MYSGLPHSVSAMDATDRCRAKPKSAGCAGMRRHKRPHGMHKRAGTHHQGQGAQAPRGKCPRALVRVCVRAQGAGLQPIAPTSSSGGTSPARTPKTDARQECSCCRWPRRSAIGAHSWQCCVKGTRSRSTKAAARSHTYFQLRVGALVRQQEVLRLQVPVNQVVGPQELHTVGCTRCTHADTTYAHIPACLPVGPFGAT